MNRTVQLLQIASLVPFPPDDGGRVAVYHTARQFTKHGVSVHFAAPGTDGESTREFRRVVEQLTLLDLNPRYSIVGGIRNLVSALPLNIEKYHRREALRQLSDVVTAARIDAIQVESLHMAWYAIELKKATGIPIILREHNYQTGLMDRYRMQIRNPFLRAYVGNQVRRMRAYEAWAVRQFDSVATITALDAQSLQHIEPRVRCTTIPAGVDADALAFDTPRMQSTVLFLLNYDWIPNVDAFTYYIEEVLPLIRTQRPDLRTIVVGKGTERIPASLRPASVEVRGFLPDLNDITSLAPIAIVPLRIAGGMRVKILEFMAKGMTVVSTSVGAEGVGASDREEIVIADSAKDFADAIVGLIQDAQTCRRIAERARQLVEARYSWDKVGDLFCENLERVIRSASNQGRQSGGAR